MASYVTHKTPKNKAWLARQHLRPWMWALLGFPRFEGAKSRKDHDYRSRRRKVRFSDSRVLQRGQLKRGQVPGFFQKLPPASSALRPVPRHTIGRASCRQSAIMCAGIYKTVRRFTCPRNEGRAKLERPSNEAIRGIGLARKSSKGAGQQT